MKEKKNNNFAHSCFRYVVLFPRPTHFQIFHYERVVLYSYPVFIPYDATQ